MIIVRTPVTDTLNSVSIAALICGFVASLCTRNAYSLRAPYAADDFSVTTGRTIVSCSSGIVRLLRLFRLLRARAFVQRTDFDHDRLRPQDLVRRRVGEPHHAHVRDVATGEVDVVRVGGGQQQHLLAGGLELLEQPGELLRLRLLVFERVDDHKRALAGPRVERRLLGQLAHLLRDPEAVAARMRPMRDAAVPPVRRAGRALPGAAGALLPPRLLIATRDLAARLGVARALPLIRQE